MGVTLLFKKFFQKQEGEEEELNNKSINSERW
jgi:hypothetical protein